MIRVTAPAGTDITMPMAGRTAHASSGLFREKGQWGNLPTGEAYLAPLEGAVARRRRRRRVDGGRRHGRASRFASSSRTATRRDITGGEAAAKLIALLEPHGQDGRNVAEFGIGTNDRAIITGVILEDEKVMGTIHIAFGDNKSMGGTRARREPPRRPRDASPTVWFDDRMVMDAGRLLVGD